jgi:hypothetical protein
MREIGVAKIEEEEEVQGQRSLGQSGMRRKLRTSECFQEECR